MRARMSGGGACGPHKPGWRGQGVPAPLGLVAHWCGPQTDSLSQYFSNIPEKIILDFHSVRRTFIFGVFFYRTLKQKTGKTKLNLSFFF